MDLSIDDNRVTLINIYGPNSDNPQFVKISEIYFENLTFNTIY